jgi:hypothetical protein
MNVDIVLVCAYRNGLDPDVVQKTVFAQISLAFTQEILIDIVPFCEKELSLDECVIGFVMKRIQKAKYPGTILRQLGIEYVKRIYVDLVHLVLALFKIRCGGSIVRAYETGKQ